MKYYTVYRFIFAALNLCVFCTFGLLRAFCFCIILIGDIALSVAEEKLNFEDQSNRTKVMDQNVKPYLDKNLLNEMYTYLYVYILPGSK